MLYQYHIVGLDLLCEIPFSVVIQEEARDFLSVLDVEEPGKCDAKVYFKPVEQLPEIPESAYLISDRYYSHTEVGEQVHHCPCSGELPYACVRWENEKHLVITCNYLKEQEWRFAYSRVISDHIGMETLFLKYRCLLVHASFIRWGQKGILFSAPSGTGKSTQAELWSSYEQAEILNGDRAAVRKELDSWYAYGLPYAGSSGIYRNEKAKLEAVVVLRQSSKNSIREIGVGEAVRYLYPEVMIHKWDTEFVDIAVDILMELVKEIPIYLLECLPNKEAVYVLKEMLEGGIE